jgi:hypothetical protein
VTCQICGHELYYRWSDLHGEGVCSTCGTPYQILQYDEQNRRIPDAAPSINVRDEYVPWLKRYWEETHQHMGLGQYVLAVPYAKKRKAFNDWMDQHCTIPKESEEQPT